MPACAGMTELRCRWVIVSAGWYKATRNNSRFTWCRARAYPRQGDLSSTTRIVDLGKAVDDLPAQAMTVWAARAPNGAVIFARRHFGRVRPNLIGADNFFAVCPSFALRRVHLGLRLLPEVTES